MPISGTINQKLLATAKIAMQAGFTPEQAKIMAAIAGGESTFRADIVNDNPATRDLSYGLWQINMYDKLGPARLRQFGLSSYDDLKDPLTNARAAKAIFDAQGYEAWGAYKDGNAAKFMTAAKQLDLSNVSSQPPAAQPPAAQPQQTKVPTAKAKAAKTTLATMRKQAAQITPLFGNKGTGESIKVKGVGTFVSGRNFFGMGEDKYFDPDGNRITRGEFESTFAAQTKRLTNQSAETTTQTVQPQSQMVPNPSHGPTTTGSPVTTGTGLTDVVPVENLQSIGAGTGEVGMTSGRGMRKNPVSGKYKHHAGVDIGTSGKKGYYVAFKLKGMVQDVGTFPGYGETVVITSGDKDFLFAHLALGSIMVQKGQAYNGEIIGEIGNTGAGTGEHLHFEVSPKGTGGYGKDEDPMPYVKYLVIGKMGDGSAVTTRPAAPKITQGPSTPVQPSPSVVPPGPATRNIEQYPSYDLGDNNVYIIGQNGQPQPVMPGGGRKSSVMRTGVSTKSMLNSYYKQQLLGLLYKVG